MNQTTQAAVSSTVVRLVLCSYRHNGRTIMRWLKPYTVVEVPCIQCGSHEFAYAQDAKDFVCMDCCACNTENDKAHGRETAKEDV